MASLENIDAIALAGGKGSRLLPAVSDVPKPLAVVAGRPVIEYVLDQIRAAGCRRVVLSLGHRADEIITYLDNRPQDGLTLIPAVEPEPLDTGGALRFALDQTDSDEVLALNVDSYLDVDFADLVAFKHEKQTPVALFAGFVEYARRSGSLDLDEQDFVRGFREKDPDAQGEGWINGGIYLLDRAVLEALPLGQRISLERDVFPTLCDGRLAALKRKRDFLDIGTPESYALADAFFRDRRSDLKEAQS